MIVDHAGGLHVGINNRAADKLETALPEVARQRIRFFRCRRNLVHPLPSILDRAVADEAPYVVAESVKFLPDVEKRPSIADGCINLEPISNDPGIVEQPGNLAVTETGHLFRIELRKCLAVCGALVENGGPGQSGLRSLENQEFKLGAIVADRHPPLFVMIGKIQIVAATHPATPLTLILVVHVPPRRKIEKGPAASVPRAPLSLAINGSQRSDRSAALAFTAFALAFRFVATAFAFAALAFAFGFLVTAALAFAAFAFAFALGVFLVTAALAFTAFTFAGVGGHVAAGKCRHRKRGRVSAGRGNHQRACQSTSNSNGNRLQHVFLRHRPHSSLELALPGLVNFWHRARGLNQKLQSTLWVICSVSGSSASPSRPTTALLPSPTGNMSPS